MTHIVPLSQAHGIARFGGKADSLASLSSAGIPVPEGFVVAVDAYHKHRDAIRTLEGEPRSLICDIPIDEALADEFRMAWMNCVGTSGRAAVRSSALVEDSPSASFAGQFHTELHVGSVQNGLAALRRCWASLFSAHANAYAIHQPELAGHSTGEDKNGMCVVVQRMIDATVAGVAFTREPITSSEAVVYVEWIRGVGESLVSGDKVDGRIWIDTTGRALRADYLNDATPIPSEQIWLALAGHLKRVSAVLGPGQDVEWALSDNGQICILQARPITGAVHSEDSTAIPPPWVLPGRPWKGWSEEQRRFFDLWDEYNPGAVTPLDYDLFMRNIWCASLEMLDEGNGAPPIEDVVIRVHAVPVAIDPSIPPAAVTRTPTDVPLADLVPQWRNTAEQLNRKAGDLTKIDDSRLFEIIVEAGRCHSEFASVRLIQMNEWIEGEESTASALSRLLINISESVETIVSELRAGVDHETARMNQALHRLAQCAVGGTDDYWLTDFEDFLTRYGHVEIAGTLVSDAREVLLASIRQTAAAGPSEDPLIEVRRRYEQRRIEIRALLPEHSRMEFDEAIADLRRWIALREDSKTLENLPLLLLRKTIAEANRRLRTFEMLPKHGDIAHLTLDELRDALVDGLQIEANFQQRAALVSWKRERSWLPANFLGMNCEPDATRFQGLGASAGKVSGPVRIVSGVEQFDLVEGGDILVASATNPAWTILFSRIAAVVVENGSRLSHAAIVAREFGLPAVVGLPGITDALRSGDYVLVDGTSGEVTRINPADQC